MRKKLILIFEDEFHLKEGLEIGKEKKEKKEKNMDEYKPTARQLVTIKGLKIKKFHLILIADLKFTKNENKKYFKDPKCSRYFNEKLNSVVILLPCSQ